MNELINNNWFVSIATGLIVMVIPKVFDFIKHHLSKKGIVGKLIRKSNLSTLIYVRKTLKDEVKINKEIVKYYAYLIIFLLSLMIYFWLIICLTILSENFRIYANNHNLTYNIFILIGGFPIYIFELLYLNQKDLVEKIFKFRKNK
jgi:hypothetical protein